MMGLRWLLILSLVVSCDTAGGEPAAAAGSDVCTAGTGACEGQDGESAARIRAFQDWLDANQLPVNMLKVESMPVFRMGTTARQPLREGQLYVAVPDSLLIGPERVGAGSRLQEKLDAIAQQHGRPPLHIDNRIKLIMFLLREARGSRKKPSFWKPYIDLLPPELSNPFMWSEAELMLLEGSDVADAARQEKRRLRAEYDQLRSHVFTHDRKTFPKEAFSLKKWMWACALYDSRVIQLNRQNQQGNTPTWIPLIDMVNCIESQDKTFIKYDSGLKAAVMYADRNTASGAQVFESYGNKSNYEYLLYNGFVMQENPNDCVYVTLVLPGAKGGRRQVCLASTGVPRLAQIWAQTSSGQAGDNSPTARAKARSRLVLFLREKLQKYSKTQDEDSKLLLSLETGQPARANEAMAVRMRIHEKTTLSRLLVALENGTIDCCGVDSAAT